MSPARAEASRVKCRWPSALVSGLLSAAGGVLLFLVTGSVAVQVGATLSIMTVLGLLWVGRRPDRSVTKPKTTVGGYFVRFLLGIAVFVITAPLLGAVGLAGGDLFGLASATVAAIAIASTVSSVVGVSFDRRGTSALLGQEDGDDI